MFSPFHAAIHAALHAPLRRIISRLLRPCFSPRRYWVSEASITKLTTSPSYPPSFAAIGHAAGVRAWHPTASGNVKSEFAPVGAVVELDGARCTGLAQEGSMVAVGDCSPAGRVTIWETGSGGAGGSSGGGWRRLQVLEAGSPVASLALRGQFLAAGTAAGYVRVWRLNLDGGQFEVLFTPDLSLSPGEPLRNVLLTSPAATAAGAAAASTLLVVHSGAKNRIGVWRLETGKLLHTMGMAADAATDATARIAANVVHAVAAQDLVALVSWLPGHPGAIVQVVDVVSRSGSVLEQPDQTMAAYGEPLCADFDGGVLLVGYAAGAVCAFSNARSWTGWHGGAVGAAACLPRRQQVVSGGADGSIKLWTSAGDLLAVHDVGFQVTSLAAGDVHVLVGGSKGELQMLVLAAAGEDGAAGGSGAASAATAQQKAAAAEAPQQPVRAYDVYFDSRQVSAVSSSSSAAAATVPKACGRADQHPDAFAQFVPPRQWITPERGTSVAPAATTTSEVAAGSKGSTFNPRAALKGAAGGDGDASSGSGGGGGDDKDSIEARRQQQRAMGEDAGVARRPEVTLESNTSAVGRKCDNPSCLNRWGLGGLEFKRCGACRQAFYCSQHCQRTHWRDGHKQECPKLQASLTVGA